METNGHEMVSVFVLTYNQEGFVGQMLEGILNQVTDYEVQIIIGDDASSDNTIGIIKAYQSKYPGKISLLENNENMGISKNFLRTLGHCQGKYIAICDGDDYWIDNNKLQRQVEFLEAHNDYDIVFTSKMDMFGDGTQEEDSRPDMPVDTDFELLVKGNFIASVTCLFRNKTRNREVPSWIDGLPFGDWPLYLWTVVDGGKIRYLKEPTAVYRREIGTSDGLRSDHLTGLDVQLKILRLMRHDTHFKTRVHQIDKAIRRLKELRMTQLLKRRKWTSGLFTFISLYISKPNWRLVKNFLKAILKGLK